MTDTLNTANTAMTDTLDAANMANAIPMRDAICQDTRNTAKETYNTAKETYNTAKETYNTAKETYSPGPASAPNWLAQALPSAGSVGSWLSYVADQVWLAEFILCPN
jgi:hypothetical protein